MSDFVFASSGLALWVTLSWLLIKAKDDDNAIIQYRFLQVWQ